MITISSYPKDIDTLGNNRTIFRLSSNQSGNADYKMKVIVLQNNVEIARSFLDMVNGIVVFNIASFFEDVYPEPDIPAVLYHWSFPRVIDLPFLKLKFSDNYSGNYTHYVYALNGRIEKHLYDRFITHEGTVSLISSPLVKRSCWDTPEYFTFLRTQAEYYNGFILQTVLYYKNGTTELINRNVDLSEYQTACFPLSLKYYGYSEDREIYKYTVQLLNSGGGGIGSLRTYQIVQNVKGQNVYGFINTRFGVFETVVCRGKFTEKPNNKFNSWEYAGDEYRQVLSSSTIEYEQNTGLMTEEEAKFASQLTRSANHLYILRNDEWVRVKLLDFSETVISNQEGLHSFSFRFETMDRI